jgi:hypothetical protein
MKRPSIKAKPRLSTIAAGIYKWKKQEPYSQHLIFFLTEAWAQYSRLERLAKDKHSSLLGPFVSYEENEEL